MEFIRNSGPESTSKNSLLCLILVLRLRIELIKNPNQRLPLAAVSDTLGRVHLIDTSTMSILRIIKGHRVRG